MPKEKKKKEESSKRKKRFSGEFIWLLMLFIWAAGIFTASSIPGSGEHYWDLGVFLERKGAHIFEFFVLAYLVWKVTDFHETAFSKKIFFVFLMPFIYAVSDEAHQLFVFGREGKPLDVGIDLIGILSFILLILIWRRIFSKEKTPA
ncbi:MAG: VanZ family protein [Parcubacteria group bacterium]